LYLFISGQISSVDNTANDFQNLTRIGDHIHDVPFAYNVMFIVDGEGQRSFGKSVKKYFSRIYRLSICLIIDLFIKKVVEQ